MDNFLKCKICGKENIEDIVNHVLIKHGITYQQYCEQYYKIPVNYQYILTPQLVQKIIKFYKNTAIPIKNFFIDVAVKNQYLLSRLMAQFGEYTVAIYQYLEIDINHDN